MCVCVCVWEDCPVRQSTLSQGSEKVLCSRPRQVHVDLAAREVTGKDLKASHLPRRKYEELPKFFFEPCPVILV